MRVLIIEYLHAQSTAFQYSPDSMLAEGKMMLDAMIEDLGRIDNLSGHVALCDAAIPKIRSHTTSVLPISSGPEADFDEQLLAACDDQYFDSVVLVAPECNGILTTITRRLRHKNFNVAIASLPAISLCTDKWSTFQFLQRQRITSIPTRLLTDFTALQLGNHQHWVIKPSDGAGCEGIVKLKPDQLASHLASAKQAQVASPTSQPYIVQPFIDGVSYSIGLIGQGQASAPLGLPVAEQKINWSDGRPTYAGGIIPAAMMDTASDNITSIAQKIAKALNFENGYLGIDFLVDKVSQEIFVTEINPRLCTSYVGYRQATSTNLLAVMLRQHQREKIEWTSTPIHFGV